MAAIDITKPDNGADMLIMLQISGNRLVSICNAAQALMHETGKLRHPWYQELDQVIEAVRDQLGAQRMEKNFPGYSEREGAR
jgi:hypothetical protein